MRGMDKTLVRDLPQIGFIVFDNEIPVCAIFLRRIEGGYGLVDSAISNPEVSPIYRREAIDLASRVVVEYAKVIEIKQLLVLSTDANTIARAKSFDFVQAKDTLLQLNLYKM